MPDNNNGYGHIRIRQLPESASLQNEDYLVIENDVDTWKVRVSTFYDYINSILENFKDTMGGSVDDKIIAIQQIINDNTEISNQINIMIEDYKKDEEERNKNEIERQTNETIRNNTYTEIQTTIDEWDNEEAIRKANEIIRVSNESERSENEINRQNNEYAREQNEITRGTEENKRLSNEDIRVSNEGIRIDNYNLMHSYYKAVKEAFNNYCKEGISNFTTSSAKIMKILTISIPTDPNDYVGLYNLSIVNENVDIFFALKITVNSDGDIIPYIALPEQYKNTYKSNFIINYGKDTSIGQVIITVRYMANEANSTIRTAIVWDNISSFKHDIVSIYSLANKKETAIDTAPTSGLVTLTDMPQSEKNYPYTFIRLLDIVDNLNNSSLPFNLYPIGSIYQTTSESNPSEILGGGEWHLLYGDGISEGVIVDNTQQYSPTIYYWERIS